MAEKKEGRGCFFYGIIAFIVLVVVVLGVVGTSGYLFLRHARDTYLSKKPIAVAPVTLTDKEGEQVQQRVDDFRRELNSGRQPVPLELTSDQLDYIVRNSTNYVHMRDAIHVAIDNNEIHAELSFPMETINPNLFTGRYLNGRAKLGLALTNGAVAIDLKSIEINGQPAPGWLVSDWKQKGIEWRPQAGDPDADLVRNLGSVEILDDKIVFKPKVRPAAKSAQDPKSR